MLRGVIASQWGGNRRILMNSWITLIEASPRCEGGWGEGKGGSWQSFKRRFFKRVNFDGNMQLSVSEEQTRLSLEKWVLWQHKKSYLAGVSQGSLLPPVLFCFCRNKNQSLVPLHLLVVTMVFQQSPCRIDEYESENFTSLVHRVWSPNIF